MTGLTDFVDEYKVFMKWLNGKNKDPNEYVRQFEMIFSVATETELLREIQDMKDELNMLSAVFRDQKSVLEKVGETIKRSRMALLSKTEGINLSESSEESSLSAFSFQQQTEKHAGHIKRMQDQANQAYTNVSVLSHRSQTSANTYPEQLQDLLNFKQQQANVLEARVNRNQAITSKEQNKIIMVFTIVTIIFVSVRCASP
jgi:Mg2+ and Co2+ transporter CorA